MCLSVKTLKKNLTFKNLKKFLRYDRVNITLFIAIIIVHILLSVGLAFLGMAYNTFISILYALFNLPIFLTTFSLSGYSIYTLNTFTVILPLIAHVIYWYVLACLIRVPIVAKKETFRYKSALFIVSLFLFFALVVCVWLSLSIGTIYLFY